MRSSRNVNENNKYSCYKCKYPHYLYPLTHKKYKLMKGEPYYAGY